MNPLNSILLEGNVVRDSVFKETPKGTPFCTFTIASNRCYRTESGTFDQEVSFFDVETWGHLADMCNKNCKKGRGVRVVGRLKQGRWTDDEGKAHTRISIVGDHVEFRPLFSTTKEDDEKDEKVDGKGKAKKERFAKVEAENTPDVAVF